MWQKLKNLYHLAQAFIASVYFNFPSRQLTVIGITGTDGKTTTVWMVYEILKNSGFKVSQISSLGALVGTSRFDTGFHTTTPSPWQIQKYLRKAVNLMHIRDSVGKATQEEIQSLAKIAQFVKDNQLLDLAGFKGWLKFRLAPTRREAEIAEIVAPAPFSLEEAAILATEIHLRRQILEKYQIEPVPENLVRELIRQMPERLEITEEELFRSRNDALCKMIQIVKENLIDDVYDQQESEAVRDFLVYFLVLPVYNRFYES